MFKELTEEFMKMTNALNKLNNSFQQNQISAKVQIGQLENEVHDLKHRIVRLEMLNLSLRSNEVAESSTSTKRNPKKKKELMKSKSAGDLLTNNLGKGHGKVPFEHSQKLFHNRESKHDSDQLGTKIDQVFMSESENSWDKKACHADLAIIGPDNLVVKTKETKNRSSSNASVFAKSDITKNNFGIFYYEVKLIKGARPASIGLARKAMGVRGWIGYAKDSYGYSSAGYLLGDGKTIKNNMPQFQVGDIIGCAVHMVTKKLTYTRNGEVLDIGNLTVSSTDGLFPCITFSGEQNIEIEANFGPNYNFDTVLATLLQTMNADQNSEAPQQ
ncbi:hypothetical protein niasHT_032385 [Heterodera trifolii]|uniref:B30.2/SPRY domain-containing protein n=1 Tax=Heterodera trifolii TaxID=157864 RepID=A0ABD2HYM7_9BILA